MDLCDPWADYLKKFFTDIKIIQTTLRYNTKHSKAINPMVLCDPWD